MPRKVKKSKVKKSQIRKLKINNSARNTTKKDSLKKNNRQSHIKNNDELSLFARNLKKLIFKKRRFILLIAISLFLCLIFFDIIKMGVVLGLLLLSNIFISYIAKNIPRYNTALELMMFSTILSGISYGPKVGAFVGFIFSILYYFGTNRMSIYVTIFAPLYAIFGIIAGTLPVNNVFVFGMLCVILYSIISSILVSILFNAHIDKAIGFIFINTVFNLVMFKYIAPIFMLLM